MNVRIKNQFPIYVYGLKKEGRFLYVGQTATPNIRKYSNTSRSRTDPAWRKAKNFDFVIIRKTNCEHALRIESQIIRALWKHGQCELNKTANATAVKQLSYKGVKVCHKPSQRMFISINATARAFGLSRSTIMNRLQSKSEFDYAK